MDNQPIHMELDLTIAAFLARTTAAHGDRTALIFGDEVISYDQLRADVRQFEAALIGLGLGKGSRVALLTSSRPEWVVAALATMAIGAVFIPLSTYEPAVKRHDALRHSDASVLIIQENLLRHRFLDDLIAEVPPLADTDTFRHPSLPFLRTVITLTGESRGSIRTWDEFVGSAPTLEPEFLDALESEVHPTDDALVIYTSGTSGTAKGVIHPHRSLVVQFDRLPDLFTITADDVVWGTFPLFWSAGIAWLLGAPLAAGSAVVLTESYDPDEAIALIERHRISVVQVTQPQVTQLEEAYARNPADISSVRILPPRTTLADVIGLPADRPYGGAAFGLTEAVTWAAAHPWDAPLSYRTEHHGPPLPGIRMRIIDPETGEVLPTGQHGEIAIKGTGVMRGYHKMFPEAYLDEDSYYRTKDGGFIDDDGFLHWTGRISAIIRVNSANVSPAEVEAALYDDPDISLAAVVGADDPRTGERIIALVVPRPGATLTEDGVRARARERLAAYKVPSQVLFATSEDVPMTGTNKPVLAAVQALVAARLAAG